MSALQEEIVNFKSEIQGFIGMKLNDLNSATTKEDNMMYGGLITETRTLNIKRTPNSTAAAATTIRW